MGLFDFDIHDETPERFTLHDISADRGETWTQQWLTPSDVLQHRMSGYVTRLHVVDKEARRGSMIQTVRDLIEKLQQFDPDMMLDVDVSWYDRHNYNHAHRNIWEYGDKGIELCVIEDEPGIVCISNMDAEDVYLYED